MRRSQSAAELGRKRYWREADARAVLAELEASGLSMAAFCRKHGLKSKRVSRWRNMLGAGVAKRVAQPTMELVPVRVVQRGDCGVGGVSEVEVVLRNGRRLAVGRGFDQDLLAEVAEVVERWPC